MKTSVKKSLVCFIGIVALAIFAFAVNASAEYIETFDTGNASWHYGYGSDWKSPESPATWVSPGGNPDGHISGSSANLYAVWTDTNVTATYGDMTGLTLTVDTKVTDSETGTAQFYVGDSTTNTYYVESVGWNIGADTIWTTHQLALDASNFTYWSGSLSLAQVLQAPNDIGIFFGGGLAGGTGALLVDNYGTVPEPGTLTLLGLAGLAMVWIRRRKSSG